MAERFHRRSIRLKGYDHLRPVSALRRMTVCTHERAHLFGVVVNDAMDPTPMGSIMQSAVRRIGMRYRNTFRMWMSTCSW